MSILRSDAALVLASIFLCLSGSVQGNGYCQWIKTGTANTLKCEEVEKEIFESYINIPVKGIDCGSSLTIDVRVTGLSALNNNTLRIQEYKCKGLQALILRHNLITSVSDDALKSDTVTKLDLSGNSITGLSFLKSLPQLKEVDLQANKLTQIAKDVPWPKNLLKVNLRSNAIAILDLSSLSIAEELILAGNELKKLDDNVFKGKNTLLTLDLNTNSIDQLTKNKLQGLPNLRKLYLGRNNITTLENGAFEILTSLTHLDLQRNPFAGFNENTFKGLTATTLNLSEMTNWNELKPNIFKSPKNLESLYIGLNTFGELKVGSLTGLKSVNVYSTCWTENIVFDLCNLGITKIESKVLRELSQNNGIYKSIILSHNKLTTLVRDMFINVTGVGSVLLDSNEIASIEVDAFKNLTFIGNSYRSNILDLSKNKLTNLSSATGMDKIVNANEIKLDHNEIAIIQANSFKGLSFRRGSLVNKIHLHNNSLTKLENNAFAEIANLNVLVLSNNSIDTIEAGTFSNTFTPENSLSNALHLDHNNIQKLTKNSLLGLFFLNVLDLSHNVIQEIEKGALNHLEKLIHLDLSHNKIATVTRPIFETLVELKTLNLNGNELTRLDANVFADISHLSELHLSENRISSIQDGAFNATKIDELDLSHNQLSSLSKNALINITDLRSLDISHNRLAFITDSLHSLKELRLLDLSHNEIATIATEAFVSQKYVTTLFLGHNRFVSFQTGTFNNLKNLHHLDLSNNNLNVLQPGLFLAPENLMNLLLHNNNLTSFEAKYVFSNWNNPMTLHITIHNNSLDCQFLSDLFLMYPYQIVSEIPTIPETTNNVRGVNCRDVLNRTSSATTGARLASPVLLVAGVAAFARSIYYH